jgi:uncharacterized protein (UPF0216 family)
MDDESVFRRWMGLEMRKINEGVAETRVSLHSLLLMEKPVTITRGGQEFRFDKRVLEKIASRLPVPLQKKLRLPVIFYYDADVPASCFLSDRVAFEALREMGELSREREFEGGRVFVGRAIVFALMRSYPTAFQIMMR